MTCVTNGQTNGPCGNWVTGQTFLDPTATFTNSNIGGNTSGLYTAHIDTSFAYNPIGALIHLFRDVLHIGGPRKPC